MRLLLDAISPAVAPSPVQTAAPSCHGACTPPTAAPSPLRMNWGMVALAFSACAVLALLGPGLCYLFRSRLQFRRRADVVRRSQPPHMAEAPKLPLMSDPVPIVTVEGIFVVQPNNEAEFAIFTRPGQQQPPEKEDEVEGQPSASSARSDAVEFSQHDCEPEGAPLEWMPADGGKQACLNPDEGFATPESKADKISGEASSEPETERRAPSSSRWRVTQDGFGAPHRDT